MRSRLHHIAMCLCAVSLALDATNRPEPVVTRWDAPGISSPQWESHPAFDPLTGDIWFVRSDATFSGWRILTSHCEGHRWSEPREMPFAGSGLEADPFFSADGRTLYFISSRQTGEIKSSALG
jgi:Tol biopolymer transport system component